MRGTGWKAAVIVLWMGLVAGHAGAEGLYVEDGVYRIESFRALEEFSQIVSEAEEGFSGEARLMCDIEAEGEIQPIGSAEHMFVGIFDGGGYTISGLTISDGGDFQGLFGYVGMGGRVMNLTLRDVWAAGSRYTGGVAAYSAGTILNCRVEGGWVTGTGNMEYSTATGGVVGLSSGKIEGCVNMGATVVGKRYVGGIVGSQCAGSVKRCVSAGTVRSRDLGQALAGGIAGGVQTGAVIRECISAGSVNAPCARWAGGIAGGLLSGKMLSCLSLGRVVGQEAGGVAGFAAQHAQIMNCRFAPWTECGVGEGRQAGASGFEGGRRFHIRIRWLTGLIGK